jgi:sialate O-acetylesterase
MKLFPTRPIVHGILLVFMILVGNALADVRLPKLIADHMVLQRGIPLTVWGWADPGEQVTVSIANQIVKTSADPGGKWKVGLQALAAGGPLGMTVAGKNRIEVSDILVGDVWVCCGQSNMEMPVGNLYRPKVYPGVTDFRAELARADHPGIRLFLPDHQTSLAPKEDLPGTGWQVCTPETVARFSAVGYFFARHLNSRMNVPVGMIQAAKSSTTAEAWTSPEGLRTLPSWSRRLEKHAGAAAKPSPAPTDQQLPQESDNPTAPSTVEVPFGTPGGLFDGMIAPVTPFAIKGVIFYQGENNAKDPKGYGTLFPALIRSWRQAWGQGDFPFLFVQLAAYGGKPKAPREDRGWAAQREAQTAGLKEPKTGMAVTIDIGSERLIHPPDKQEVGRRLGLLAQAIAYGQNVEASGPVLRSMTIEGGKVRLKFDNAAGGLVARPFEQGKPKITVTKLTGFTVAGSDKVHHWADAEIVGDEVIVSSPVVPMPVSVRYAWAGNPDCNLFNKANLPAAPFRSGEE